MSMDPFSDEDQDAGGGFNPADILRIFLRRKWLFLIPFVLCLGMAYLAIRTMQPIYFSAGQLRVIHEDTAARSLTEGMPRYRNSRDAELETMTLIRTMVTSPIFLERVLVAQDVHISDLMPDFAADNGIRPDQPVDGVYLDRMVSFLEKSIRVRSEDSQIYTIGVRHTNRELAFRLANDVLERFLDEEQAAREERTTTTRDFLTEQRQIILENLEDAQQRLTEFQRNMLSTSLVGNPVNEQNMSMAESLREDLRRRVEAMDDVDIPQARTAARAVLPAVDQLADRIAMEADALSLARDVSDLEYSQVVATLTGRQSSEDQNMLGSMRLSLDSKLGRRLLEDYPQLGGADRRTVTSYLFALQYREALNYALNRFGGEISEFRTFITRQPEQAATLGRLQSEVETAQQMLRNIEQDISRENLSLAASMSEIGYRIEVRRDPRLPPSPIEPDKKRLALLGFALALAIGVGLVLLAEMFDRSFKSVRQIESTLKLKVIGTLPVVDDGPFENLRRRRILKWFVIVAAILGVAALGLFVVYPRIQ